MHGGMQDLIVIKWFRPKGESFSGQADYQLHIIFVILCVKQRMCYACVNPHQIHFTSYQSAIPTRPVGGLVVYFHSVT